MTDLKHIRKALGISRTEVCKATGVSYHTWKHWEDGDRRCPDYAWTLLYFWFRHGKDKFGSVLPPTDLREGYFKRSLQRFASKADSKAD
tara:strand:- start:48 stop:314 length:267 start_codon:yes stop_codon:yes gene_type:complete